MVWFKNLINSFFFLLIIVLNTVIRSLMLYIYAFLRFILPGSFYKKFFFVRIVKTGESWVATNTWAIKTFTQTQFQIDFELDVTKSESYLIIANHQSWVDILVLQMIFNKKVPFIRFFIKQELKWIPFLGLAFRILDFPFMKRFSREYLQKHPEMAGKDKETTKAICQKIAYRPFSMINFLEGTRFTEQKHKKQNSPFQNLLQPKAGGVAYTLEAFEGKVDKILDVTMVFEAPQGSSFLDLASNKIKNIKVAVQEIPLPNDLNFADYENNKEEKQRIQSWVNDLWLQKDLHLTQLKRL